MIPGKILIIDDKRGEVDSLIDEFSEMGEHVVYSDELVKEECYNNIRLLIMDYWIHEDDEENSLDTIATVIKEASEKSKFFMTAIWSVKTTEENKTQYQKNIVERYLKNNKEETSIPCVLLEPMSKKDLDYLQLIKRIEEEIKKHPNLNLLYEAEQIVDKAKDCVANQIYALGGWSNLTKTLQNEYDIDSIGRQILSIYFNFLKRCYSPSAQFKECITELLSSKDDFNLNDFAKVFGAQYYFNVGENEQVGTGDILFNKEKVKYCIVMTPECDITQNKHTAITLVESMKFTHDELADREKLRDLAKTFDLRNKEGKLEGPSQTVSALLFNSGIASNYCTLPFLTDPTSGKYYHLIFDFHKMIQVNKTKDLKELPEYARICRVDVPLINSFIQKYTSHCSRFGVMSFPKEEIKAKLSAELAENEKSKKEREKGKVTTKSG